jgi:hypothetical protein
MYLDYPTKSDIGKSWSYLNKLESTYVRKLSCKINMTYFGWVVLKEKIFQWPHQSLHFCDYLPFEEELVLYLYNFEIPLPKNDLYHV